MGIIRIDIDNSEEFSLKELVKEINVFPLETNDSCLIGERYTMQVRNGYTYINNDQKEVLQFDKEGKFMRSTLSSRGQGPDDYIIAYSSYVDRDNNLGIYEMYFPRIQEYNKNFEFLKSIKMNVPNTLSPQLNRSHLKLNDSIYVIKDYKDIHFYSISKGQVIKTVHHEFPDLLSITTHMRLADYNDKIHYSHSYSCDTLFYIDEKDLDLKPEIIFDFRGQSFNIKDLPSEMSNQYYQKFLVETGKILVLEKINLSDKQFCFFLKDDKSYVSRTTSRGTNIYLMHKNGSLPIPRAVENDKFYTLVWPDKLEDYINDTELINEESLKRIKQIKEDDNPVLICYVLK